jgi:5'-deoxynucleotidase YfbR-like HD superfamily hydrolase
MSYITTYTGKHFDPVNPEIELIDIKDIAHALSLICRGNGQVKSFFSVGQHCINAAKEAKLRGYSNRVILACLIHDAGESYLSDVPRPLKPSMPEYIRTENQLLDLIYEKYLGSPLTTEEAVLVKAIDNALLYYDLKELLNEVSEGEKPELHIELNYELIPFDLVEQEYLELFYKYFGGQL